MNKYPYNYGFNRGYDQIQKQHVRKVRLEIMEALGIPKNNRQTFYDRLNGKTDPTIPEAKKIVAVFLKYDILDIWNHNSI